MLGRLISAGRATRTTDAAAAADTVLRLAVLLQAGIAPARAWQHLAENGDPAATSVRDAMAEGTSMIDAISRAGDAPHGGGGRAVGPTTTARVRDSTAPWDDVAAAWRVATVVGAPLAASLRSHASALRDAQETADDVRAALAEPAGTARLLSWLPLVAVGLGAALGFDTFTVLLTSPVGWGCIVAGGALTVVSHRWTRRLVRAQAAPDSFPGRTAELLAIALGSGVSVDRALDLAGQAGAEADAECTRVLALSREAGVPAVELLRAHGAYERHRARVEGRLRAARLSSRLLLPLGVCTLPAFLLLGVAPLFLGVLASTPLII
ncbi:tight adherence protein B [Microbacterium terrae]|uniref:type II secretion system F family protein n=2 Tax=Microbacterium terrae TaxID=69369 RepID=UPI001B5AFD7A|nr:type II secretion system F family protein [Microbacterium terrae]MBP1076615.1 tight adherence protein B [Microbacterium terrae]GLJ97443.1 hypothetical protein GCM10017594_06400 [Microbacterium terrae]